jgi:hypothetical protein
MRAASLNAMGLGEDNNCPSFLAGYSALPCLAPNVYVFGRPFFDENEVTT